MSISDKCKEIKDVISIKDAIDITGETLINQIPIGGPLINNVWTQMKNNVFHRRLKEWQDIVEERLSKLDKSLDDIGNNDAFASIFTKATEIALKTSEERKKQYLANAVFHSASINIDENIMIIYMYILDKYTIIHFDILYFLYNPLAFDDIVEKKKTYCMGSPKRPLYDHFPELKENDVLVNKFVKDLYDDGLININDLNGTMSVQGMLAKRTTKLGCGFVNFVMK